MVEHFLPLIASDVVRNAVPVNHPPRYRSNCVPNRATRCEVKERNIEQPQPHFQIRGIGNALGDWLTIPNALLNDRFLALSYIETVKQDIPQFPASASSTVARNSAAFCDWRMTSSNKSGRSVKSLMQFSRLNGIGLPARSVTPLQPSTTASA